ncbi:hypothetical protein ACN91_15105 [Bacillus cereus]|uniref:hypothetical protein n=1 Tax=Bacillus cereus TaxID=1396 RepID=UPI0006AD6FAA|nr:hypothetical protein [Bacillus cereus]ALC52858.1 hypothetical protein ACN91_15105 [Bacillus cereus]
MAGDVRTFDYKFSEKAFLDLWEEWGKPEEINNSEEIFKFLTGLMDKTNGWVIWDHFSKSHYDYINKIEYSRPFTYIQWKDYNKFRKGFLAGELDDFSDMEWGMSGYATYVYTVLDISKLKFKRYGNHLYLIFKVNLIADNIIDKHFKLKGKNKLISKKSMPNDFYKEYMFWEGDEKENIKHLCKINTLPFYTGLIQPKERETPAVLSRLIMLNETLNEVHSRMCKVHDNLITLDEYDIDSLLSQGNTIRRILEYTLKFYCLYKEIDVEIDRKYGHVTLGDLKKEINKHSEEIEIDQSLVNIANELSHDSGKVISKDEIHDFWKDSAKIVMQISNVIEKCL